MSYSENVLGELIRRAQLSRCGLFEAAADYCEEHDLEPEEFMAGLDKNAFEQIKASAINDRKVRRCVQEPTATLI